MPNQSTSAPLVAALLYDGLCTFEFGIAAEIFGLPRPELGDGWYRFVTVSEDRRPLRANGGVLVSAEAGLEKLADAAMVIIPGWTADDRQPSTALKRALVDAHDRGARVVSICSGAFLLAACGLLDGKAATTHWRYADILRQRYPGIAVDADCLYADAGSVMTSAGSAAGIDLLLHIVRTDFGPKVANHVARRLVMPPHRDGGQAQFVQRPVAARPESRFAKLMERMQGDPAGDWSVASMAQAAAMSERTFIRRFRDATGCPPGEWLTALRVDAARTLLEAEEGDLSIVAEAAGFGSLETLRHHFRKRVGVSPTAYRARFSARA